MFYIVSWGRWCHLVVVGTNHPLCSNDLCPLQPDYKTNNLKEVRLVVVSNLELENIRDYSFQFMYSNIFY